MNENGHFMVLQETGKKSQYCLIFLNSLYVLDPCYLQISAKIAAHVFTQAYDSGVLIYVVTRGSPPLLHHHERCPCMVKCINIVPSKQHLQSFFPNIISADSPTLGVFYRLENLI